MTATLTSGIRIGKAQVIVDIIPKGNPEIRPGTYMEPKFVTYHNTGNSGKGADAEAHNTYIHNQASLSIKDTTHVSWHFTVDENYIYQHLPMNECAYHCGDGFTVGSGNRTSVGIEIAEHVDQHNYIQAEENAIALGLYIAKLWNIPNENHVPHQKWSGKYCPRVILKRDGSFGKFKARIIEAASSPLVVRGDDELAYSSKALRERAQFNTTSPGRKQMIIEEAIEAGVIDASWRKKLQDGAATDGDILSIGTETLVRKVKAE